MGTGNRREGYQRHARYGVLAGIGRGQAGVEPVAGDAGQVEDSPEQVGLADAAGLAGPGDAAAVDGDVGPGGSVGRPLDAAQQDAAAAGAAVAVPGLAPHLDPAGAGRVHPAGGHVLLLGRPQQPDGLLLGEDQLHGSLQGLGDGRTPLPSDGRRAGFSSGSASAGRMNRSRRRNEGPSEPVRPLHQPPRRSCGTCTSSASPRSSGPSTWSSACSGSPSPGSPTSPGPRTTSSCCSGSTRCTTSSTSPSGRCGWPPRGPRPAPAPSASSSAPCTWRSGSWGCSSTAART